jgi:formate dehydrogenase major subunit
MTRRSSSLQERDPELYIEISPEDAANLNIHDGDIVMIKTRRGEAKVKARLTEKVTPGVVFMPFHWQGTNLLTCDALDPVSKIPEYKVAACRIEAIS